MEHVAFANLSDLQVVLTRMVYEDRRALPLSWRRALGFRRMLERARAAVPKPASVTAVPRAPHVHEQSAACERRDAASPGAALRRRAPEPAPGTAQGQAYEPRRAALAGVRRIAPAVAQAAREGRTLCALDLSGEGLGRIQIFIRRRGDRIDCAVLCAREARPVVARALAAARELLARGGLRLVPVPDGEAS